MKFTITNNEEFKSVEIAFDGKPSASVIAVLKAHRFRWHNLRRIWYGYTSAETIEKAINGAESGNTDSKQEQPATVENIDGYKVGDIFYTSWGYEQTNIDYYQVIKVTEKTLTVREIASKITREYGMSGRSCAEPNAFVKDRNGDYNEFTTRRSKRLYNGVGLYHDNSSCHNTLYPTTAEAEHSWSSWH